MIDLLEQTANGQGDFASCGDVGSQVLHGVNNLHYCHSPVANTPRPTKKLPGAAAPQGGWHSVSPYRAVGDSLVANGRHRD
jgi:hypothetical protein